jgi:hypothetical protein
MNQESVASLEVVDQLWEEYVSDFQSDNIVCDQVMIIAEGLLLRSPNYDLLSRSTGPSLFIH